MPTAPTMEELAARLDRLEAIQRLEGELLAMKLGHDSSSSDIAPASMPTKKAADYLGVSTSTLWKLVADGKLPAPKGVGSTALRLWPRKDLDLFLRELPRQRKEKSKR